ncbi:MAG: anaerobic sulfatase maturase [Theionarchaea archaeon]|nr:anaerobic sulfatase maturase [Theionarchaea archaeon]
MLPESLLIKPVSASCNLSCQYCFYLGKSELYPERPGHMSDEVLEEMVSQFMGMTSKQAAFSWQGGEPLLAGLEFYQRAIQLQKKYGRGHVVSNSFQTNGTRLNENWTEFFRKYKFLVGISLDGPKEIHDHYRRKRGGGSTYDDVMAGIELLKDGRVDFNVLSVVNDVSARKPVEIYEFLRGQGINFLQFVPCLEWNREGDSPTEFSVGPREYGDFLCKIFDLWVRDYPEVYVRLFNSVLAMRLGMGRGLCTLGPACGEYVVVEHNGDVYPCDFFVEPETLLGNIMETPLRTIVEGTDLLSFARKKSSLEEKCRNCKWVDLCFGGCQYHRRNSPRSFFCSSYERFFDYAEGGFLKIESSL